MGACTGLVQLTRTIRMLAVCGCLGLGLPAAGGVAGGCRGSPGRGAVFFFLSDGSLCVVGLWVALGWYAAGRPSLGSKRLLQRSSGIHEVRLPYDIGRESWEWEMARAGVV